MVGIVEELKSAALTLANVAANRTLMGHGDEALKYSQAALNLVNAASVAKNNNLNSKEDPTAI